MTSEVMIGGIEARALELPSRVGEVDLAIEARLGQFERERADRDARIAALDETPTWRGPLAHAGGA